MEIPATTSGTRILPCLKCRPHAFQDHVYGPGMRVMNPCMPGKLPERYYRCTVCGEVRTGKSEEKARSGKATKPAGG